MLGPVMVWRGEYIEDLLILLMRLSGSAEEVRRLNKLMRRINRYGLFIKLRGL